MKKEILLLFLVFLLSLTFNSPVLADSKSVIIEYRSSGQVSEGLTTTLRSHRNETDYPVAWSWSLETKMNEIWNLPENRLKQLGFEKNYEYSLLHKQSYTIPVKSVAYLHEKKFTRSDAYWYIKVRCWWDEDSKSFKSEELERDVIFKFVTWYEYSMVCKSLED